MCQIEQILNQSQFEKTAEKTRGMGLVQNIAWYSDSMKPAAHFTTKYIIHVVQQEQPAGAGAAVVLLCFWANV